jgi:dATP pyrophosphohydrolase
MFVKIMAPITHKIPESVLVLIHTSELEVLLLERADHPGFWQSVTGSKDSQQESPTFTARRELFEETGIVVQGMLPSGVPLMSNQAYYLLNDRKKSIEYEIYEHWRWRYAPGVTKNTEHWFSICVPNTVSLTIAPREHIAYQWLPWQEAAAKCFSQSNTDAIDTLAAVVSNQI